MRGADFVAETRSSCGVCSGRRFQLTPPRPTCPLSGPPCNRSACARRKNRLYLTMSAPDASRPILRVSTTQRASAGTSRLQTGYVYHYAFAMLIGVVLLVSWYLAFQVFRVR